MFWESNPRIRPKIGEDWTRIATAMVARSPAVRWWYVREHLLAVIVTLVQHNWVPIRHTSWKDPEGNRWSLNSARVRIDDWGFWQAFRPSIEGQLWEKAARHELGAGLDGGAELTTLLKHDKFLEEKSGMNGRSDDIEPGWWSRRYARGALKRTRTCITVFGSARVWQYRANEGEIFDKTQHLVFKATHAKVTLDCFWLRGWCHALGRCKTQETGTWRQFGNGVLTDACTFSFGDGSGTHSDPRVRRVGRAAVITQGTSNCL